MDELRKLRELAGPALGDEDAVRQAARARLTETMGGAEVGRRIRRSWLPRLAVGGVAMVAAGVMAVSFINADKTPAGLPGDGLYEAVGEVVQMDGWQSPRLCIDRMPDCQGPDLVGWDWRLVSTDLVQIQSGPNLGEGTGRSSRVAYRLVGRFDGDRFVLGERPLPAPPHSIPYGYESPADELNAVCVASGSAGERPTIATFSQIETAIAKSLRGHRVTISLDSFQTPRVVNVRTDRAAAAQIPKIRAVYQGPLCLMEGTVLDADFASRVLDWRETQPEPFRGQLATVSSVAMTPLSEAAVVWSTFDDGALQRAANERFGAGRVRVQSIFRPALTDAGDVERFWGMVGRPRVAVLEPLEKRSLADLRRQASTIVRGRIVGVAPEPVPVGTRLFAVDVRVQVLGVIGGSPVTGTFNVRLALGQPQSRSLARRAARTMARTAHDQEIVAFLKGAGPYTPVSSLGIWARTTLALVDAPLANHPPGQVGRFFPDTAGVQTLDQLVDAINYVGEFETIRVPK